MAGEGFDVEEWDADFLDQIIQAEEQALSSQKPNHHHHHPPFPPAPPLWREICHSPPPELSQRTHETHKISSSFDAFAPRLDYIAKEKEIDSLQKELNRVSKQLNHLESECLDLRMEKDKKEEQLKELHSKIETKDAEFHLTDNKERDGLVSYPSATGISTMCQNAYPSNKQLGSWTKSCSHSKKLFGLWNSNNQKQGIVLVGQLYKTCEEDFHVLFGYLNSPENDSTQPVETAKVLHLYSVFTKIINDTSRLEDLLEALANLCNLRNVFIVHWSLHVLRKILSDSFSMETEFVKRENVTVDDAFPESIRNDTNGCGDSAKESLCFENMAEMLKKCHAPSARKLSIVKTSGFGGVSNHHFATSVSGAYQVSLFERMCLIATKNNEERIRCEALSIMNLILMRHNAYLDREKFAGELVFRSLSQLLRKEAGFSVQDQAVHALYLLCNCPKVIDMISSCLKEDGEVACSNDINGNSVPAFQGLNEILTSLPDCVTCYGSTTVEEMKLRRNAIVFLAFLGSSGKSGFEILLKHRVIKGANFLAIILQSLISDLDLEALKSAKKPGIAREQSLIIREALILLNRLVSHPQYSIPALQALTETRNMASMTLDVANRLTRKSNLLWQDNSSTKHVREAEIVELALVFRKRVFTFFRDNISG